MRKTSGGPGFRATALAAILSFALTGCATLPADAPTEKVDYRACLITQDDALGEATGLNELSEYGVKQAVVTYGVDFESLSSGKSKFASDVKFLAKKKCSSIVVSGPELVGLVPEAAVAYPEINFLLVGPAPTLSKIDGSIGNLAVYGVDLFEAGMVQGYLAASISKVHRVGLYLQPQVEDGGIQAGVRAGVKIFDEQNQTQTEVFAPGLLLADYSAPGYVDVALLPTNAPLEAALLEIKNSGVAIVALGGDLYENDLVKDLRAQIFSSVRPDVAGRIMELIASDLEGEFVGGSLGSSTATFGNGGIKLSPEHEQNYAAGLVDSLNQFTLDYETRIR